MTSSQNRRRILELVDEALDAGASQKRVSEELGLSQRTLRRWREGGSDDRPAAQRAQPKNALSEDERYEIIRVCNQNEHQSKATGEGLNIENLKQLNQITNQYIGNHLEF